MDMLWLPLTLLCAFSVATSDALVKRALAARHNEYLIAWLRLVIALPVVLPLYLIAPAPHLGEDFYRPALAALPLEVAALLLYVKALKLSPLGLTVPFLSLTPLFLLVIPSLVLGERVTATGGAGVVLIAVGSYLLNLTSLKNGLLEPFRAILRERGSLCMIAVALIYSLTSTLGKKAIAASSPFLFAAFYFPLLALAITPIALWNGSRELRGLVRSGTLRAALAPGLCYTVEIVTHIIAVSLANVAYMIAVKRLSLLMGVLYGHFMFGEEGVGERMLGASLMIGGVALIVIGGR